MVAELIDIVVLISSWALSLVITTPLLKYYEGNFQYVGVAIVVLAFIAAPILVQYLFWKDGRSIGKVYIGFVVVHEDTQDKVDFSIMLIREAFSKWLSLWIVCIPVFIGKKGIHELATKTELKIYKKPKK
jgi:uncharacterized RDD family membrane protein YckC